MMATMLRPLKAAASRRITPGIGCAVDRPTDCVARTPLFASWRRCDRRSRAQNRPGRFAVANGGHHEYRIAALEISRVSPRKRGQAVGFDTQQRDACQKILGFDPGFVLPARDINHENAVGTENDVVDGKNETVVADCASSTETTGTENRR